MSEFARARACLCVCVCVCACVRACVRTCVNREGVWREIMKVNGPGKWKLGQGRESIKTTVPITGTGTFHFSHAGNRKRRGGGGGRQAGF